TLRTRLGADPSALRSWLTERGLRLDLEALHPLSRWITPVGEGRRYDTRYFVAIAPAGQDGAHGGPGTMASFWGTPAGIPRARDAGEVQLAPATDRTLAELGAFRSSEEVLAFAQTSSLEPICPLLVRHAVAGSEDTLALTLPGDPAHDVTEVRVSGPSRYVL